MKSKIEEILDLLLIEIKQGRSIEDCLKEYPEFADELAPLLRLAAKIEDLPKPEPDPEVVKAVIAKAQNIAISVKSLQRKFSFRKLILMKPAVARGFAAVLLIFVIGWTTVFLSARTLPGDILYPVKRLTEKIQYFLTVGPEGKAELHLVFADKRTEEFVLIFKEGELIDRELLDTMLYETEMASKYSKLLPADRLVKYIEKINTCNRHQMQALQKIMPLVCSCDTAVIEAAINLCAERHHCVNCEACPDSTHDHRCPCLDK